MGKVKNLILEREIKHEKHRINSLNGKGKDSARISEIPDSAVSIP